MGSTHLKNNGSIIATIFFAATLGYLLVLKTFWFHDDWYFLANAAGIADLGKGGSRWISYEGYWKLFYPVFGLNTHAWAITRLFLHAGSSWFVFRLGRKLGLQPNAALLAGLLFAASPVAFESLYWGTGVVELLGTFFALACIQRWLSGGTKNTVWAVLWGILAMGSKESGFFIPLFFLIHMIAGRKVGYVRVAAVITLGFAALGAGLLLMQNLEGSGEYSLSLAGIPRNVLMLCFWLVAPPSLQMGTEADLPWALITGGFLLLIWLGLSIKSWRQGTTLPLWLLVISLLAMGPALVLDDHILPRYNYGPMAAWVISLAFFCRNWLPQPRRRWLVSAVLLVVVLSWWSTQYRVNARFPRGRAMHRLVLKEEISRTICRNLNNLKLEQNDRLVFFLEPDGNSIANGYIQDSLGGVLGPQLVLSHGMKAKWTTELHPEDIGAYVISVRGLDVEPLGRYRPKHGKPSQ